MIFIGGLFQISISPISKFDKFGLNFEMLLEPFWGVTCVFLVSSLGLTLKFLASYLAPWVPGAPFGLHLGPQLKGFWVSLFSDAIWESIWDTPGD